MLRGSVASQGHSVKNLMFHARGSICKSFAVRCCTHVLGVASVYDPVQKALDHAPHVYDGDGHPKLRFAPFKVCAKA